jgi:hypothetical protein
MEISGRAMVAWNENVQGRAHLNAAWVAKAMAHSPHRRVILGMDRSESPVDGAPEGAA